jgi:hypothetical protein
MSDEWAKIVEALEALATFFERLEGPAGYFREISSMIQQGKLEEAERELTGLTLWGGSGSFIDLLIHPDNHFAIREEDVGSVNLEYRKLLLELLERVECVAPREWMSQKKALLTDSIAYYSNLSG